MAETPEPRDLIRLQVKYQTLTRLDKGNAEIAENDYRFLGTGTRNSLKYQILFNDDEITSSKWKGKSKVVVFTTPDGFTITQFYPPETDEGLYKQYFPVSMLDETSFEMSVYSLGEEKITTNPITIEFKKSGYRNTVNTGLTSFNQEHDLPYLYKAEYTSLDYPYAMKYFKREDIPAPEGACSAVYDLSHGLMGRNLDWVYSEMAECIIKTPNTIGVAGAMTEFTREFVESGEYNELYRILPFYLQDGINKTGLCCATLVTPNLVSHSVPIEEVKESVSSIMLVRYILDHFPSLKEAVDYLKYYVEITFHPKLCKMGYNQHWILSQGDTCCVIEVTETGELKAINYSSGVCAVTNFHLDGVTFNTDGTVYTPSTQTSTEDAVKTNHIHPYGSGLERFNRIKISPTSTTDELKTLLKELRYSKIYDTNTAWYTDFANPDDGLTCNTRKEIYENVVERYSRIYPLRNRTAGSVGYGFWNTNHSSIYDTSSKKLLICSQEDYGLDNTKWYDYSL